MPEAIKEPVANPLDKLNSETKTAEDIYDVKDKSYLTFLQDRLTKAKTVRNSPLADYNNKTYLQIYEEDEKIANTFLEEKKNKDDVIVSAGTVEAKIDALLANINSLDLGVEVLSFDRENNKLNELGLAMQDTIRMTEEHDGGDESGDEEKKMLRQRELLKHGTVFVQEEWLRLFETKKVLNEKFDGKFKDFKGFTEKSELAFEGPGRTLLHGPNVYLGDITEFFMDKQPCVFVVINQDYKVAQTKYGKFENWKFVKPGAAPSTIKEEEKTIFDNKWRLTEVKDNQVEIIIYQDQPRDEFQVIINGVLMLPIGFPLSAVTPGGKYNIAKQVYRIINSKFAYGKSFVSSGAVKELSALIDEMLKLFVLKTRKSYSPPYVNTSGKVISEKVLTAGRISMGFSPDALQKIGEEGQGVTSNEFNFMKELQDRVDKSTVSNQFQGQQGKSGTTATEVVELQRQSKLTLGLAVAVCALLEKKLGYLRLWNILQNWYEPLETKVVTVNDARKEAKEANRYRNTIREVNIEGEGLGERQVIPTDEALPSPEVIRQLEYKAQAETGTPSQKIFLSPAALKAAKVRWYIVINPKDKEGSAFFKLLYREKLADMITLMSLGSTPNRDGLEEGFSRAWGENRSKLFAKANVGPDVSGVSPNSKAPGRSNAAGIPAGIPGGVGE